MFSFRLKNSYLRRERDSSMNGPAQVTVENEYGDAPLHTTVRYGHSDLLPLVLAVDLRRDFNNAAGAANLPEKFAKTDHLNLQNAVRENTLLCS